MAAIVELWETLKHAITAYTGLSASAFFAAVALAVTVYYGVSSLFAPPPPPPRAIGRREMEEVEPLPPPVQIGEVTEEELRVYDGSDPKKPLLMAIKGQIYDVSQSRMFYGPGGPYALFAGKDASRALAKMSFEEKDLTGDISGLGPFELDALQDWEYKFMSKYVKVGTVQKPVPVSDGSSETVEIAERSAPVAETDTANTSAEHEAGTPVTENGFVDTPAEHEAEVMQSVESEDTPAFKGPESEEDDPTHKADAKLSVESETIPADHAIEKKEEEDDTPVHVAAPKDIALGEGAKEE